MTSQLEALKQEKSTLDDKLVIGERFYCLVFGAIHYASN